MSAEFFDHPILNSPYEEPKRHWALTSDGQPTQLINETRRPADFVTPIPKPRKTSKKKGQAEGQTAAVLADGTGITTTVQGFGENIQSQAALNEAQAQAIIAASQTAAQTTAIRLQNEAEAQKRRDDLILYIVIAIAAVPILGMVIYYGLKK